jgi:hypothetical protein
LKCTHFLVADASESARVKRQNHGFSSVLRKRDLSLVGGSEGKGRGGVSNVDHDAGSGIKPLYFLKALVDVDEQRFEHRI